VGLQVEDKFSPTFDVDDYEKFCSFLQSDAANWKMAGFIPTMILKAENEEITLRQE